MENKPDILALLDSQEMVEAVADAMFEYGNREYCHMKAQRVIDTIKQKFNLTKGE